MSMLFKQKVFDCCMKLLDDKISNLQVVLNDLKSGVENDSKSSAGDKHETAQAMMQLEHEKISRQLDELLNQKNSLTKIDLKILSDKIISGSLIKTNKMFLFLSMPIGKIIVDEKPVMIFSPQSPLGIKMLGKKIGDSVEMNNVIYKIEKIE